MARLKKNDYPSLSKDQLKNPILFVVDMVNGFVKEGALHDTAIAQAAKPIQTLIEMLDCPSIFVCDCHPEDAREFQSYPQHCVMGTSEAEVIDELKPLIKREIPKNSTNTFFAPDFQTFLEQEANRYNDFIITGCCTDICIMQFALSFQGWMNQNDKTDQRIIVPVDCVDTYHIDGVHDANDWNEMSLSTMHSNGIQVVSTIGGIEE